MEIIKLGVKGFLRRKKTSAIFACMVFISTLSIMICSLIIDVSNAFRAVSEDPYHDYYRLITDRGVMWSELKYSSKYTMFSDSYQSIERINSYFNNIADYSVQISEAVTSSAKGVIKDGISDSGLLTLYSITDCMSVSGFARGEISLIQGRYLTRSDNENSAKVCMISENLARINGYSLGNRILFRQGEKIDDTLEIVGIYKSNVWRNESNQVDSYMLFDNTVYAPVSATGHNSWANCYNYQIKLDDDRHIEKIEELVNKYSMASGFDAYFIKVSDIFEADNQGIHTLSNALNFAKFSFFISSLAIIAIYTYSLVQSRKKEIGVLFAMGYSKCRTAFVLASELALCSLIGVILAALFSAFFGEHIAEAILAFSVNDSLTNAVIATSSETISLSLEREVFVHSLVNIGLVSRCTIMSLLQALAVVTLSSLFAISWVFKINVIDLLGKGGAK